jgi:hypothetical protein
MPGEPVCRPQGWHWKKKDDPFDMVARQQALSRRSLDSLAGA